MHRALEILELVDLICAEVKRSAGAGTRGTLCSLARVCRIFSGSALDFLWMHQYTITNILRCMPADLWEVTGSDRSSSARALRAIEPEDWDRFHVYAPRVKVLLLNDYHCDPANDTFSSVYELLSASLPTAHIFPKLHTLSWTVNRLPWFCHVRLFLCPQLKTVSLGILETPAHLELLPTLPALCPSLASVTLFTGPSLYVRCPPRSIMICGLAVLERLSVGSMDQSAFGHLSLLRTLNTLTIQHEPEFIPSRAAPDAAIFPNLRELSLGRVSHEFLTAFLEMNDTWSFIRFNVYMTSNPTATETARLYALFAAKCDPATLTALTIDASSHGKPLPLHALAGAVITFDALRPLLAFQGLRQVALSPPAGVLLDDAGIEALACAWLHIWSLKLPGSAYRAPPSRVTLAGLRALVRHCPLITYLSMPFDASAVPEPQPTPDERVVLVVPDEEQSESGLRWIDVEDAVLEDPKRVAAYLYTLFPKLEVIHTARQDEVIDDEEVRARADRLHGLWKEVERLHPTARAAMDAVADAYEVAVL